MPPFAGQTFSRGLFPVSTLAWGKTEVKLTGTRNCGTLVAEGSIPWRNPEIENLEMFMNALRPLFVAVALMLVCGAGMVFGQENAGVSSAAVEPVSALEQLTKADIEVMIRKMDIAIEARDIAAIEPLLAPDVKIVIKNLPTPDGLKTMELLRDQYLQNSKDVFANAQEYKYSRQGQVIEILDGGRKAVITAVVSEHITMQGQKITSVTNERATVGIRDGKALITALEGDVIEMK